MSRHPRRIPSMPQAHKFRAPQGIRHVTQNDEEKIAQASLMMQRRLLGDSLKEIAELFQTTPSTVADRLAIARREGFIERARDIIAGRLIPKAIATLDQIMEDDSAPHETRRRAATDILFGTAAMMKKAELEVKGGGHDEVTLEAIRNERLQRLKASAIEVTPVPDGENHE